MFRGRLRGVRNRGSCLETAVQRASRNHGGGVQTCESPVVVVESGCREKRGRQVGGAGKSAGKRCGFTYKCVTEKALQTMRRSVGSFCLSERCAVATASTPWEVSERVLPSIASSLTRYRQGRFALRAPSTSDGPLSALTDCPSWTQPQTEVAALLTGTGAHSTAPTCGRLQSTQQLLTMLPIHPFDHPPRRAQIPARSLKTFRSA